MFRILPIFFLFATTAFAQTVPAPGSTLAKSNQFTAPDTVRALHNLFKSRRNTGRWLFGGSAAITVITGLGTLADNNGKGNSAYYSPDALSAALIIGIGLAPVWIPGFITLSRFSSKREGKAVEEYERTRIVNPRLQKKLSARFFNPNYQFSSKVKAHK